MSRKAAELARDRFPESTTSSVAPSSLDPSSTLRKRPISASEAVPREKMDDSHPNPNRTTDEEGALIAPGSWASRNRWVVFALASGACAAFNGVFAKLTTNDLTSNLSQALAKTFGLIAVEGTIELVVRCVFFGLNLVFNGVMWTLFTKALARGNSTTQVSIMNTSSNFMITAVLGFAIFSESLPPMWWLGAAMLVAGNVIIGRKEESSDVTEEEDAVSVEGSSSTISSYGAISHVEVVVPVEKGDDDEDVPLLGDLGEPDGR